MNPKRIIASILSLTLTASVMAGCGEKKYKGSIDYTPSDFYANSSEEDAPVVVAEPDFLGYLMGASDTDFYNMSFEEFNQAAGGEFTQENAMDYYEGSGRITAKYYLGKMDSILCGRLKLPGEFDIYCDLYFEKDQLKQMTLSAEGFTEEETTKLCEDYLKALEGKLPEGYEQVTPAEQGYYYECGYGKGINDYVATLTRKYSFGVFSIEFELDVYSERYGF